MQERVVYSAHEVSAKEAAQIAVKNDDVPSLLPPGVAPENYVRADRRADALYQVLSDVQPERYENYTIYFLEWLGSNIPFGIDVEGNGRTIDRVKDQRAYHLTNPQASPKEWTYDEIGEYRRVYDEKPLHPSGDAFHGLLLFIPKAGIQSSPSAPSAPVR